MLNLQHFYIKKTRYTTVVIKPLNIHNVKNTWYKKYGILTIVNIHNVKNTWYKKYGIFTIVNVVKTL